MPQLSLIETTTTNLKNGVMNSTPVRDPITTGIKNLASQIRKKPITRRSRKKTRLKLRNTPGTITTGSVRSTPKTPITTKARSTNIPKRSISTKDTLPMM